MYEGTALSVVVADVDIYEVYWYFLEACTSVGCGRSPNGTITATLFVALVVQPVIFTPLVTGALIVCVVLAVAAILLFLCALKRWHHFVSKRRVKLSILSHDFSLEHTYAVSVTTYSECDVHVLCFRSLRIPSLHIFRYLLVSLLCLHTYIMTECISSYVN